MSDENSVSSWVGIDLGTTNTVLAFVRNGKVEILYDSDVGAQSLTKSCVFFEQNTDKTIVGQHAMSKKLAYPKNTVYDAKRLMGIPNENPNVAKFAASVALDIVRSADGYCAFELKHAGQKMHLLPQEVGAKLLLRKRQMLEERLNARSNGQRVECRRAVITVPANFSLEQKLATEDAGKRAGFHEVHLITEPAAGFQMRFLPKFAFKSPNCSLFYTFLFASAYAYGFEHNRLGGYKVLVYDFGGGTFDVSILDVQNGEFKVLTTNGDRWLGGRDLDRALAAHLGERITKLYGDKHLRDERNRLTLETVSEQLKERMSSVEEEGVYVDFLREELFMTRDKFEELCKPLIQRSVEITAQAIRDAGLRVDQLDEVMLVGGTSNIPMVANLLEQELGIPRCKLNKSVNAMHAVAQGAAVLGAQLCERSKVSMPPMGLIETVPLSIGIKTTEDTFSVMIERNTQFPYKTENNFFTCLNDQYSIGFNVYEGERKIASQNRQLGSFAIHQLSKGAAGDVSVKLTMELDRSGILHVRATHNQAVASLKLGYKENRSDENSVSRAIADAHVHLVADTKEVKRRRAKSDLKTKIERAKYNCTDQRVLSLCAYYADLVKANENADTELLMRWLAEFNQSLVSPVRLSRRMI